MALRVVWTQKAKDEKNQILRYYLERNGNPIYSRILRRHFSQSLELVRVQERIGKLTSRDEIRCLLVLDYSLFYHLSGQDVVVLSVWDNRRDPADRPY